MKKKLCGYTSVLCIRRAKIHILKNLATVLEIAGIYQLYSSEL